MFKGATFNVPLKSMLAQLKHRSLVILICLCFLSKIPAQPCNFFANTTYDCLSMSGLTTIQFTGAAPFTYTFVNANSSATVASGSSPVATSTFTGLQAGNYNVFMTAANGCAFSINGYLYTVSSVSANIVFSSAGSSSVTCFGGNNGAAAAIPPSSFTNSPAPSYTWSPGQATTSTISNLVAGVYTVEIKDAKGCYATNTIAITEPPRIESSFSNTFISCFGKTLNTSIISSGNVGPTSYTLNGVALTSSFVTNVSPGTQTLITRDNKGCVRNNTILVSQEVQPILTFSISKPSCPGKSDGAITTSISNAPLPFSYSWSPGGANTLNVSNIVNGSYTISVADGNGCITTSVILVAPAISATVSVLTNPENCSASNGSFTLNVSGVNPPYSFITLPFGPHAGNVVNNISSGTYTAITLYNNNCVDTLRFVLGNTSNVSIAIQNSVAIRCYGNCSAAFSVSINNAVGAVTYSVSGIGTTLNNSFSNLCAGFYTIRAIDANGCAATSTINFIEPPTFSFTASGATVVCSGKPVALQGSASGGTAPYQFVWNPGAISGPLVSTVPQGTTSFSLSVFDNNNCTLLPSVVTVSVRPAITASVVGGGASVCIGSTAQITPTVSGGDGNYSFLWIPGNSTLQSILIQNITVPSYTLIVNDGCGSPTLFKQVDINLFPGTNPTFLTRQNKGCAPFCTRFVNTTEKSKLAQWNFGDGAGFKAGDSLNYCFEKAGTFDLVLSLTDSNNCRTSKSYPKFIEALAGPEPDFVSIPGEITLKNAQDVLIKNLTSNANAFTWFVDGKRLGEYNDLVYSFRDTGCYVFRLEARDKNNCANAIQKNICVAEDFTFFMPNCFTPNDNIVNDALLPKGSGWIPDRYEFEVFNRWGRRIFKTNDIGVGWDPGSTEDQVPTGNYVWQVRILDRKYFERHLRGTVILYR